MGFIFHYTRHFLCSAFECEFPFFLFCFFLSHQQMREHSVPDDQPNVLIFLPPFLISISYFMMFMVFDVMPHGFASKPCSQKYEIAF